MSNAKLATARVWRNGVELVGLMSVTVPAVSRNVVEDPRVLTGMTKVLGYVRYSPLVIDVIDSTTLLALILAIASNSLDAYAVQTADAYITFSARAMELKYMVATVDGIYGATVSIQPTGTVVWDGQSLGVLATPVVDDVLLLEDGTALLLETGDTIAL